MKIFNILKRINHVSALILENKELKHRIDFWKNSNQGNYERWKEANYELIKLKEKLNHVETNV